MTKSIGGYGRYMDDPEYVGCPRAKSDMTPCIARDGATALADDGVCVGCGVSSTGLLLDLQREAGGGSEEVVTVPERAADELAAWVRRVTAP